MLSLTARDNIQNDLRHYKRKYLGKKFENLDESSTRVIVNHLLTDVLGYKELVNIKTEYPVVGGYMDYLVEVDGRKLLVVEVKSAGTTLKFKHLRQATYYALSAGVSIVVLTNAKDLQVYRLRFKDHLIIDHLFSVDLTRLDETTAELVASLSRKLLINRGV